jgi:hypothetical protein
MSEAKVDPALPKKPKVLIDNIEVEVEPGSVIIQAAKKAGKYIPHFCYHEGLSIVGQCRMCFVEIEGQKKLATACSTPVADGMKIKTNSEAVQKGQNGTLEFILLNHPLDCPICDRGGECKLQDYTLEYGPPRSRMVDDKVLRDKHRHVSSQVVLDQERCILCTRCTRFSSEVDGRAELVVNERGNASHIDVFEGKEFSSPFSGNVVDLCPVGALTAEDFRFEARPWELKTHEAVCTSCAVGCNVEIHTKHRHPGIPRAGTPVRPQIKRLMPRENLQVNEWWMCDKGRWGYHFHNEDGKRIHNPMIKKSGGLQSVSLKEWTLELEGSNDWEFWIDGTFPHEGIAWVKDLANSWKERGRKVDINPSSHGEKFLKIWSKFVASSPWGVAAANWTGIKEVVSTKSYRDLESVAPILSLKLGQRVRKGQLKWTIVADISSVKASDEVAFLADVPRNKESLDQLEKVSTKAKLLILWTQVNSRGLVNEGIAPTELLGDGGTSTQNVFLFSQKTTNALPSGLNAKINLAKKLFVANSFLDDSWSTKAQGVLPLAPLYETIATLTNLEGHKQSSHGIQIYHPNTPSINRGTVEMINPSLRLI